ncbi:hypothetical protein [Nocardia sp. NPDC057030]
MTTYTRRTHPLRHGRDAVHGTGIGTVHQPYQGAPPAEGEYQR